MAFLRFSRDKRGYEHFYIVQSTTNRRGKSRSRVLYWFRTPPNVKVGREPFDEDVRRALEGRNPDVAFDWQGMLDTPIPPPVQAERWRERRRAERAAKQAAQVEAAAAAEPQDPAAEGVAADEPAMSEPVEPLELLEPPEPLEPLEPPVPDDEV